MDLEICMTLFIPSSDKSERTALSSIRVPKDERIGPPIFQLEDRWRIRGGPHAQYRIGPLLFLPTTPPPRSSPVLQFHQLEDCWRTREGPQDQQRISPPLFLPTTPPSRSSLVLQDRWRTREGPQDQHRIGPPLFLPITPPP